MFQEKKAKGQEQKKPFSNEKEIKIDSQQSDYEKEADEMSLKIIHGDQVMGGGGTPEGQIMGGVGKNEGMISMKGAESGVEGMIAPEHVQQTLDATKGSGNQLPEEAKRLVKGKTSWDLDDVKIHTDSNAAELSKEVNAKAFTYGKDIYFGQGQFDTYSSQGKQLLAHELAHTVQNNGRGNPPLQRSAFAEKDEASKNITLRSNMVYYGYEASDAVATSASNEIQNMWNATKGTTKIGSDVYSVNFDISHEVVSINKAVEMAKSNAKNAENNFVRVEKNNSEDRSFYLGLGTNVAHFATKDNLGTSTTAAHEYGHSIGLDHPEASYVKGQPDIMVPRGTGVDAKYTYNPKLGASKANKKGVYDSNTIKPEKRLVSQKNIDDLKLDTKLAAGSANIGEAKNWLLGADGKFASTSQQLHANPYGSSVQGDNTRFFDETTQKLIQENTPKIAPADKTRIAPNYVPFKR